MSDLQKLRNSLEATCKKLCDIANTAEKNNQSLAGNGFYGKKFHIGLVELAKIEPKIIAALIAAKLQVSDVELMRKNLTIIKSTEKQNKKRHIAFKALILFIHGIGDIAFSDNSAPPTPSSEPVLPKSVVIPAKKNYLVTVVIQANQCYESRCFDACGVMVRKFVEILIIELYEAHGKEAEIKDGNGDYFMLSRLVDAVLNTTHWNLGRESKTALPKVKSLGDRAAHNRRFLATATDVDAVIPGLRVLVDDLLHLAGLK